MTTTMIRGLVVRLLLRRCLQPPRLCRSQIVWWFQIWTSQALKIIVPLSLCLTMLNLLELWDLWCLLLLWAKLAGFFCVYVFVWFNELSWPGWFILLLIVWNKLGFVWVFGFLSVLDFWVFFDFMILAMNIWGRTRKTNGFSAWVFQYWSFSMGENLKETDNGVYPKGFLKSTNVWFHSHVCIQH